MSVAMALSGKLLIPVIGVVLLCGVVFAGELNYDDINTLPTEEKRRIIRELLRAQRDIRGALLKIHYSLNGEEFDADGKEDPYWQGCWDKELAGYRQSIEAKVNALSSGLEQAHQLMDEINERVKPHWYGHHKPGYGGSYGEYGPPGYGPGYGPDYEGGYRPGGNRRYGRELDVSKQTEAEATQAEVKAEKAVDPIEESAVIDALEQLSEAKQ
ncbi:uncharacterized protein LOC118511508 isoform X2 [Anopheles stephensi]|uniref:uncharacterized protein LOC118511508 isoform X2 n=1 Tax=Anopheles stephensi TaxID=30069 RepID=UPI001658BB53|nr:uncharacterized protein LOC118511508 isoform X2 [Anopheles stephensi]